MNALPANTAPPANKPPGKSRRRNKNKSDGSGNKPNSISEKPTASTDPPSPVDAAPADAHREVNGHPPATSDSGKQERESLRDVAKRLKKLSKKLEHIKRSEDKIKDLSEEDKATTTLINADERKKLQDKPITLAIHKELQEVYDKLKESTDAEDKIIEQRFEQQKHDYEGKLLNATKEAKEEGLKEGREEKVSEGTEKVNTLLKFLRLAGYRRSVTSDSPQEDEAIEQVLVLVYSGDSSAMEACMKLAEGSSESVVEDHSVSFARVKELAHELRIDDDEDENVAGESTTQVESPNDVPVQVEQASQGQDTHPPQQTLTEAQAEGAPPAPAAASSGEDASNEAGRTLEAASSPGLPDGWVNVEQEKAQDSNALSEVSGNADKPLTLTGTSKTSGNKDGEFHSVEPKRGRSGRGGFRGRGEGSSRGRGRGGFRGDRGGGEYRGNGEYRGRGYRSRRGDGQRNKGEQGQGAQTQPQPQSQPQPQPQPANSS